MNDLLRRMLPAAAAAMLLAPPAQAACCYFSAKEKDVNQPAQKAFITWNPAVGIETFTVQPKFEGDAENFGMVIPTPGQPKLDEMPRDFFKELAVFTILKQRKFPESKYFPLYGLMRAASGRAIGGSFGRSYRQLASSVRVLESGVVGTLDYKIITAERADDLYAWLRAHEYHYAGDEATLDHYVRKGWFFTVMKIDPKQMKRGRDGTYQGEVTPTRFRFESDELVYPLRITKISVREKTEALFYVQAPYKVDLPGDMTYQYQWVPMLQNARGWYAKGIFGDDKLPGGGSRWIARLEPHVSDLLTRGRELGFNFVSGQRPGPNRQGRIATTLEWSKRLTAEDIRVLQGLTPYSDTLPDVDEGIDPTSWKNDQEKWREAAKLIEARIEKYRRERPGGYLIREAPDEDIRQLKILQGHLQEGLFLTKIRKTFTLGEMDEDLLIFPAGFGGFRDDSEYEEILPTSPP